MGKRVNLGPLLGIPSVGRDVLCFRPRFLALLDCVSRANAVARASIVRPSVRRPSVKPVFSETVKQINAKFCGKVAIHHISRPFFPFLKILDFLILTIF